MLEKKQGFLEKQIEEQLSIIKANGTKNKRLALQALKKKKRLEAQLNQIDGNCFFFFCFRNLYFN